MNCLFASARFGAITALTFTSALTLVVSPALAAENPYAAEVISYHPGIGASPYDNPLVVLGEPTRFTGVGVFPAVVSVFNPPWGVDDIVSIGAGGHLTIRFDTPVEDHPNNPFGIDFIIFGNTAFMDTWPTTETVQGLFGDDGGIVEVSDDGIAWHVVRKAEADGMFPPIGYLDAGAYDEKPGRVPSDFRKPVDPSLSLDDFLGLHYDEVLELYDGSGGGTGIDIGPTGLAQITYVRVSNPPDAFAAVEVDGLAIVKRPLMGDLDDNGIVDGFDLLILLGQWGVCPRPAKPGAKGACTADLNGDGYVDGFDLLILLGNWGS